MNQVRFVLVRPRTGGNVGAVARALKNFGHTDWAVVDGAAALDSDEARWLAVQSEDRLREARRSGSLTEAVADAAWVVGTSSRARKGIRRLAPHVFAAEAVQRLAAGPVALVFGEERSGLSNDELDLCHDISCLPTDPSQPSVNLAQAVLLYAYELRRALTTAPEPPQLPKAATDGEFHMLSATMERLLGASGFLTHDSRPALQTLMDPLIRSRLTKAEWAMWMAAVQSTLKRLS